MGWIVPVAILLVALLGAAALFASVPARDIASVVRLAPGLALTLAGAALLATGRISAGLVALVVGLRILSWARAASRPPGATTRRSTVRSALLEMTLDHDTGEMDGEVLTGAFDGRKLASLSPDELMSLLRGSGADPESVALLEAYLDRRMPRWREDAQAHKRPGQAGPAGAGPMSKEEAYQVLGLEPGAAAKDIREAHRRLMKRLHPDSGGSTFLASKINEAKDTLLG